MMAQDGHTTTYENDIVPTCSPLGYGTILKDMMPRATTTVAIHSFVW
jgi:hypothetical protein